LKKFGMYIGFSFVLMYKIHCIKIKYNFYLHSTVKSSILFLNPKIQFTSRYVLCVCVYGILYICIGNSGYCIRDYYEMLARNHLDHKSVFWKMGMYWQRCQLNSEEYVNWKLQYANTCGRFRWKNNFSNQDTKYARMWHVRCLLQSHNSRIDIN